MCRRFQYTKIRPGFGGVDAHAADEHRENRPCGFESILEAILVAAQGSFSEGVQEVFSQPLDMSAKSLLL